jgi:hypothetical protein
MSTIVEVKSVDNDDFVSQGDIFKNVKYIYEYTETEDHVDIVEITFPYIIILSQACDLRGMHEVRNKNGKSTKQMISVLSAPLFDKSKVQDGSYLSEIIDKEITIEKGFTSKEKKIIESDFHYRYHFLNFEENFNGVPDAVIDFKQYFTLNIDSLYKNIENRICTLEPIFKEQVTLKFSTFLNRVAIP